MEKRIKKWLKKGLINLEIAEKLIADIKDEKQRRQKLQFNITIYTIGALLLGTGIISFVSANDWIFEIFASFLEIFVTNNIIKIVLLFIVTILTFWSGYNLAYEKKKLPRLGNALIFLSTLLVGATYALIGQTYNINANNAGLMFLWAISILPVAYIFRNAAVNILAVVLSVLGIIFFFADLAIDRVEVWTIFIPILCGTFFYTIGNIPIVLNKYNDFSFVYKMVGLLPIFVTLLILTCWVNESYRLVSPFYILPIVFLIVGNLLNYIFNKSTEDKLLVVETTFISSVLGMMLLLLVCDLPVELVYIIAHFAIIAIIMFGYDYGYKFENVKIISRTNNFLIIYLLLNYLRWGWTYYDKALFFIIGGILFICLGIFLENKKNVLKNKDVQ